ncbi:MAG: class I SAM-dependent methyltransferase [Desulfovibrionaceae bacterium]|nr:class I SAM-dependent methyltransferase [Desulfovibrionaceae bacterium]MBF0514701.1 class I SAM-dependent methyltransferase [Desulfovibrionaceae bacterium]
MNLIERSCPACLETVWRHVQDIETYTIQKCSGCGLIRVSVVTREDLDGFYEFIYFNNESSELIGYKKYSTNYKADRLNYLRFHKDLIDLSPGRRLFDVGAAHGLLVKVMQEVGWSAKGIDPSLYATNLAQKEYGVDIQCGTLEEYDFCGQTFDVVTLIGVFEHLVNPRLSLEKIKSILNPGGLLLIVTLNAGRFLHVYKYKPPEHLYYFNLPQLKQMLSRHGFDIKISKPYFRIYKLSEFLYRVNHLLFPWLVKPIDYLFKYFPFLDVCCRLPTNEMFVVAKKR